MCLYKARNHVQGIVFNGLCDCVECQSVIIPSGGFTDMDRHIGNHQCVPEERAKTASDHLLERVTRLYQSTADRIYLESTPCAQAKRCRFGLPF